MFSTFAKSAAVTLTLAASFTCADVAAAPWTFTTSGMIHTGSDSQGIFGIARDDLSGITYSMTTIVDPLAYKDQYGNAVYGYHAGHGRNSGTVTQTITIGGVTKTYANDAWEYYSGESYMHFNADFNQAYQYNYFNDSIGNHIQAYSSVYSNSNKFLGSWDFDQHVAYVPVSGDGGFASFTVNTSFGHASFEGRMPTFIGINDVPEPAPLALLGLGLAALALSRRKTA